MMIYDDLSIFLKVVELGTYTRTAQILNTTQSTITRRIQALEQHFKVELFVRNYRGNMELSQAGQVLYQQFHSLYQNFDTLVQEAVSQDQELHGTLRVALPAAFSRSTITPFIPQFSHKYPKVRLIIKFISKPIDLMKDNFDLAISAKLPISQSSKVKILTKFNLKLYASKSYLEKYGVPKSLSELSSEHWIGLLDESGEPITHYKVTSGNNTELVFKHEAKIYVNHIMHGMELLSNGTYLIACWNSQINNILARGEAIPILSEYSFGDQNFYLIRSSGVRSKLEKVFADFLQQIIMKQNIESASHA